MKRFLLLFVLVLTVCSTVKAQEESLTMLSPVGTIGTLDGREAMVVDLGGSIGKVAIATMNVGATNVNDYGTPFSAEDALDSDKNGLTDGWYVPSDLELTLLYPKLDFNIARTGLEWMVTGNSKLTFPGKYYSDGGGRYTGSYVSSSIIEEDEMKKVYAFYFQLDNAITYKNKGYTPSQEDISAIRPFHKLPTTYVYPVYNDPNDVTKGVKDWETETVSAIEVTSSTEPVTWGEAGKTTWYVVTGKDVTLSQGAICYGDVRLILADDSKLTANGVENYAGITIVADLGNSLTIYGQTAQSGQIVAHGGKTGAGIGSGSDYSGNEITINGGTITATGGDGAAGIGGGFHNSGAGITINGGTVTANGGSGSAGIGGGINGNGDKITINGGTVTAIGFNTGAAIGGGSGGDGNIITINGGTVTAYGGSSAAGIGGGRYGEGNVITINGGTVTARGGGAGIGSGENGANAKYIFVAANLIVKAGASEKSATTIENTASDLERSLEGKIYVTITEPYFNITANHDPDDETHYYSTFYSRTCDYQVPSGVIAYTGAVDGDVLRLTAIEGGIIPTGEAVILRLTTEEDITATKKQLTLTATTTSATKSKDNKLSGTDVAKTLGENEYALSLGQYGVGFYLWSGKPIGANKAYLTLGSSVSAKAFTFMFEDGETTAIEQPAINGKQSGDTYNLNGVRVNDNYKGIVIKNGKKVYQK